MNNLQVKDNQFTPEFFDQEDFTCIEIKAKGLTFEECLHFIGVDEEMIDDIPKHELAYARRLHRKGRADAIAKACDFLFASMSGRQGGSVALDYLKQMGSDFKVTAQENPGSSSGFSFNVIMPEDSSDG